MNFLVNTRLFKKNMEGIGNYTFEILKRLVLLRPNDKFVFLFDKQPEPKFLFANNVSYEVIFPPARHALLYDIWFNILVPYQAKKHKSDIFISLDHMGSLRLQIPQIIGIHDLSFIHYPNWIDFWNRKYMQLRLSKVIDKASKVITVSEYSKKDIVNTYGKPSQDIEVIYNGVSNELCPISPQEQNQVRSQLGNRPYFLVLGAIHPRKNITDVIDAFDSFKATHKSNHVLVLVGRKAWKYKSIFKKIENAKFSEDIKHLGYVENIYKIIAAATSLIFLSKYEGFGVPIIEALRCGVPVIASNKTCHPEIGGKHVWLTNSTKEVINSLHQICSNNSLVETKSKHGLEWSYKYDWDYSARQFNKVISNIKTDHR